MHIHVRNRAAAWNLPGQIIRSAVLVRDASFVWVVCTMAVVHSTYTTHTQLCAGHEVACAHTHTQKGRGEEQIKQRQLVPKRERILWIAGKLARQRCKTFYFSRSFEISPTNFQSQWTFSKKKERKGTVNESSMLTYPVKITWFYSLKGLHHIWWQGHYRDLLLVWVSIKYLDVWTLLLFHTRLPGT